MFFDKVLSCRWCAGSSYPFLTSKERDIETGLDYFGARYYGSTMGRFTSVDPLMASAYVGDPQTWNRYTYALNNPLKYIDPDGMKPVFGKYEDLTDEERRILENSKVTVGKVKNAQNLSGQALYDYMANKHNKMQRQLANFLNQTAVLGSVKFDNGRTARPIHAGSFFGFNTASIASQTMKVKCITIKHPMDGTPLTASNWITVGQTYVVLSLVAVPDRKVSVRLICDDGHSVALFESSQFKSVCNRIPTNWIASIGDRGVLRLTPEKWARAGFWEDYFNGDAAAIEDFEIEKDKILLEAKLR